MARSGIKFLPALFLTATLILSACQNTPQATTTPTPFTPADPTLAPTQAESPTNTPLPTRPTAAPAISEVPTATPVDQWGELTYAQTPLPALAGEITPANAYQVVPLAVWGNPKANTIALSTDGQILAVGTDLGATFYDSQSYALLAQATTPYPVTAIAFSPDQGLIALGQQQGGVDVIVKSDLNLLIRLTPAEPKAFDDARISLAFSPDSESLSLMAQSATQVRLVRWSTENWLITTSQTLAQGRVSYLSAALDLAGVIDDQNDLQMQSLSYPEESDLVDLPAGISQAFWNTLDTYGGEVVPASDGTFILIDNGTAVASWHILADDFDYLLDDYPSNIPDPCTQAPASCQNSAGGFSWVCEAADPIPPIALIALTPDDVMVLISRNDGLTEFRSAADTRVLWAIDVHFTSVSFSPGGEFFFGLRPNGVIEKRATADGELIDFLDQHPGALTDLQFSPDGSILAAAYNDGWVRVYGAADGQLLGVLNGNARSLAFSGDGNLLAAGLSDGTIRLFDLLAGSFSDLTPRHLAAINDLAFSLDGTQLVAGSADCTVSLWQADDDYRIRLLRPDAQDPFQISQVAQTRSGRWFIAAGNRPASVAYDRADFAATVLDALGPYSDLALSSDDGYLALAGEQVWLQAQPEDPPEQMPLPITETGAGLTYKLAFSPDNALLAVVSEEALSFWSVADQEIFTSVPYLQAGHFFGEPVGLAFSPYGDLIALGMENGLIQIFGIPAPTAE